MAHNMLRNAQKALGNANRFGLELLDEEPDPVQRSREDSFSALDRPLSSANPRAEPHLCNVGSRGGMPAPHAATRSMASAKEQWRRARLHGDQAAALPGARPTRTPAN